MIFSTSGFQKGALEYAAAHGIATITFIDGKSTYETRAMNSQPVEPPP
jgi:restriction system protein